MKNYVVICKDTWRVLGNVCALNLAQAQSLAVHKFADWSPNVKAIINDSDQWVLDPQ